MPIDKDAVREGTRWDYRGKQIEVVEITDRYVVYYPCDGEDAVRGYTLATPVDSFLTGARDLDMAEFIRLERTFGRGAEGCEDPKMVAKAIAYLLERVGPPTA